MKGKLSLLAGGAVGYVLGTRAGRERYEQIKSKAQGLWQDPKVQQKKAEAQAKVTDAASSAGAAAKNKVHEAKSSSSGDTSTTAPAGSAGNAGTPPSAPTSPTSPSSPSSPGSTTTTGPV